MRADVVIDLACSSESEGDSSDEQSPPGMHPKLMLDASARDVMQALRSTACGDVMRAQPTACTVWRCNEQTAQQLTWTFQRTFPAMHACSSV